MGNWLSGVHPCITLSSFATADYSSVGSGWGFLVIVPPGLVMGLVPSDTGLAILPA